MPHYMDRELAKIGDIVVGTSYNKSGTHVAVVESITEGSTNCNARIRILATVHLDGETKVVLIENTSVDYTETGNLQKVL